MLDHVSHSQISMWLRCPKQWEYRYVQGLKIPPSGALVLGGAYHTAIERNFRQKMTTKEDLSINDCLDLFSDAWEERLKEGMEINWENRSPGEFKDQGLGLVEAYRRTTSPLFQPVTVEEAFVSEIVGIKFVVVVDLIDATEIVIDHKTSSKAYTQEDVDTDLQASAEAFVLDKAIRFQNHVAVKATTPYIQVLKSHRLPPDIEWWLNMAIKVITLMKSGIAPPRPRLSSSDWYCSERFCGFYNLCKKDLVKSYF